jgi:hypothetical protein
LNDLKALKFSALVLVVLFPRIKEFSKKMQTSGTIGLPLGRFAVAISMAVRMFSFPSVLKLSIGNEILLR